MKMHIKPSSVALAVVLVACSDKTPIQPDSTAGAGGNTSSIDATSASVGQGPGAGAGGASGDGCSGCGSGARLKATMYIGEDGSRHVFDGTWFDSARNERCYATISPLGKPQCLPGVVAAYVSDNAFSDIGCSKPVAARGFVQGCAPDAVMSYATKQDTSACPLATRVYESGPMLTGTMYMIKSQACTAVDATSVPGIRFYPVGPEVNYADFVSFTETHE